MDSRNVSKLYDEYYFAHYSERPYDRDDAWLGLFASIADRIVSNIDPESVLDAGCAMGFLVEALRDRGVEAAGVDISEYAIEKVRADIKPYCHVSSVTESLSKRYDLIVCIEVLEHLSSGEAERAIENFCGHSDDILFSSTPFHYKEATHFNVQPPDYWAERFARHGFFRDVDFDASFIARWAVRFRKTRDGFPRVVASYERRLWQLEKENQGQRELNIEQQNQLEEKDKTISELTSSAAQTRQEIDDLSSRLAQHDDVTQSLFSRLNDEQRKLVTAMAQLDEREKALSRELEEKDRQIRIIKSQAAESEQTIAALSTRLVEQEQAAQRLASEVAEKEAQLAKITNTMGWRLLSLYGRKIKYPYLLPLYKLYGKIKYPYLLPIYRWLGLMPKKQKRDGDGLTLQAQAAESQYSLIPLDVFPVKNVAVAPPLQAHRASADVIVCVHNALDDVKRCLESVVRYTRMPYSLILVDDGSNEETLRYLAHFAESQGAILIRNEQAKGYTLAANQGLRASKGDYVVLLNSDTIVTADWIDRMIACGESDPHIGLIGPVSNAASWQSVPEIINDGEFVENRLPEGYTVAEMGRLVADYSGRLFPRIHFLNGFCLMIKRRVIEEIGYFDEIAFGRGYGEENDYCIRARKARWQLSVAEDAYVYHHQSRSYSHERRKELSRNADLALAAKHDQELITAGVDVCRYDRVIQGMRARAHVMAERRQIIEQGKNLWEGRRVLFILPILHSGGGGNVILDEAEAMRRMGVDVRIMNYARHQAGFEQSYTDNTIPVIYVNKENDIADLSFDFDAIIATVYSSLYWMDSLDSSSAVKGYYIQDFEPNFFPEGSTEFKRAWNSYSHYPDLVRITKTEWNRSVVKKKTGADCFVIGPSVNIDLNRPRRRDSADWPRRPLRIAAMIRPSTPRRAPELTLEVLREIYHDSKDRVELVLFGCRTDELQALGVANDFPYRNAGVLSRSEIAYLLNEVDIFVDYSSFQAMGLTAMEAMCCGAAVIVPQNGGSESFVKNQINGMVIDSGSRKECLAALQRLVDDDKLRTQLQHRAIFDICNYYPERAAFNTLKALF